MAEVILQRLDIFVVFFADILIQFAIRPPFEIPGTVHG